VTVVGVFLKTLAPSIAREGMLAVVSEVHPLKACLLITVTVSGITIDVNDEQL